jgi:hypothetical protein
MIVLRGKSSKYLSGQEHEGGFLKINTSIFGLQISQFDYEKEHD